MLVSNVRQNKHALQSFVWLIIIKWMMVYAKMYLFLPYGNVILAKTAKYSIPQCTSAKVSESWTLIC